MKFYLLLSILTIISTGICSCQPKTLKIVYSSYQDDPPTELDKAQIYRLRKQAVNADFNIIKLNNLDDHTKDSISLREIFEPVNGIYNYFQFISTFKGRALVFPGDDLKDSVKTFHDILIVKTNSENVIIDAFQYTLEWGEKPCKYDLYRGSISNISLIDNMDINILKFERTEFWNIKDKFLMDKGTIKLK